MIASCQLTRAWQDNRATLGIWQFEFIPGKSPQNFRPLFSLENPNRDTHQDDVIDAGTYLCTPHNGPKYQNVWKLENVPNHTDILIHWGNWEDDTLGCILLGMTSPGMIDNRIAIGQSKKAIDYVRDLIGVENSFNLKIVDGFLA